MDRDGKMRGGTSMESSLAAGFRWACTHPEMLKDCMKRVSPKQAESIRKMTDLIRQACLVAKDSAFNVREYTRDSSKMAFLAVKDCEKELDRIERKVDESITGAITAVSEAEARELQTDARIDEACRAIFRRHLEKSDRHKREYSTNLLFIAQAFERAGDHSKNLAEEIFQLVEGRSLRHELKRRSPGS